METPAAHDYPTEDNPRVRGDITGLSKINLPQPKCKSHRVSPVLQEVAGFLLNQGNIRLQPGDTQTVCHVLHLLVTFLGIRGVHDVRAEDGPRVTRVNLILT